MSKWRRSPDTSVRGSKSFRAETKSKPACLHRRGTREKSGILNINTRIFLTLPDEWVKLNTFLEKKVGVTGHFETFLKKKTAFSNGITYKNRHPIWSTFWRWTATKFEPRLPETISKLLHQNNWHVYVQKSKRRSHLNVEKRRHLKMAAQCCHWRAKSHPFCMPNAFCIQIWNSFVAFTASLFPWTCIRPYLRVLHAWDIACKLPSKKGRTWIEASLKVKKLHKRHDFSTQLYGTLIQGQHTIELPLVVVVMFFLYGRDIGLCKRKTSIAS